MQTFADGVCRRAGKNRYGKKSCANYADCEQDECEITRNRAERLRGLRATLNAGDTFRMQSGCAGENN
jgi:hypothetical protein